MRLAALLLMLAAASLAYVALLHYFEAYEIPLHQRFGATAAGEAAVQVYIEPVSIDARNHAMQGHVSVAPSRNGSEPLTAVPDRDLVLLLGYGKTAQEIRFPAHEPLRTANFELDLSDGNVANYPLDTYRADLSVQCFANALPPAAGAQALYAEVTIWEAVLGFHLEAAEQRNSHPTAVRLGFDIRRSGAFSLFALAAYAAMVVLGCSALVVGVMAFIGVRRPDAPLIGALGAIVFTLPALRSTLPGAPPLGVRADLLVFLWTEIAAVIALGLFVSAWARGGPPP